MTTWEDVVKFLWKHYRSEDVRWLFGDFCDSLGYAAWHERNSAIMGGEYKRMKSRMRAYRTNDLRYARQLDKGE